MINFKLPRHALLSLCVGIGIFLFFSLSYVIWIWHQDWVLSHTPLVKAAPLSTINETNAMIAALPEEHLFGQTISSGAVPITNLQLHVTGIVKSESPQAPSKAYISIANQPSKIFKVGDSVAFDVKIYDISADTVILKNDNHLEKLPLEREKLEFKPISKPKEQL